MGSAPLALQPVIGHTFVRITPIAAPAELCAFAGEAIPDDVTILRVFRVTRFIGSSKVILPLDPFR